MSVPFPADSIITQPTEEKKKLEFIISETGRDRSSLQVILQKMLPEAHVQLVSCPGLGPQCYSGEHPKQQKILSSSSGKMNIQSSLTFSTFPSYCHILMMKIFL